MCIGISPVSEFATSSNALLIPKYVAFDFLQFATYTAASASIILASGIPIILTACIADVAITSACGSASPTSSDAQITILLAKNTGSSPPFSALAKYNNVASGSDPLIDFINALILS